MQCLGGPHTLYNELQVLVMVFYFFLFFFKPKSRGGVYST